MISRYIGYSFTGGGLGAILGFIVGLVGLPTLAYIDILLPWIGTSYPRGLGVFTLVGTVIGSICGLMIAIEQEVSLAKARREEAKARREEQAERERQALNAECRSLATLRDISKTNFLSLKQLVPAANAHLDRAEKEFEERVFAPFWDEIEHAANKLAAYHKGVKKISHNASEFTHRASRLSITIPPLSFPHGDLPDARPVVARLSKIVRRAQTDFQFAVIYEQRKTNQLLYAGFGTLASAIEHMADSIASALDDLSSSLSMRLDDLLSSSKSQADLINGLTDHVGSSSDAQRRFEKKLLQETKKQSEMLDNIQRDKKPFP